MISIAMADEIDPKVQAAIKEAVAEGIKKDKDEKQNERQHELRIARNAWVPALVTALIGTVTFWAQFGQEKQKIDFTVLSKLIDADLKKRDQALTKQISDKAGETQSKIEAGKVATTVEVARMQGSVAALGSQIDRSNSVDATDTQRAQLYIANNEKLKGADGDQAVVALWFLAGRNSSSEEQKRIIATAALLAAKYNKDSTARRGLEALGPDAKKIIRGIKKDNPSLAVELAADEFLADVKKIRVETYIDVLGKQGQSAIGIEPTIRPLIKYASEGKSVALKDYEKRWSKEPMLEVPLRVVAALSGSPEYLNKVIELAKSESGRSLIARNYLGLADVRYDKQLFPLVFQYVEEETRKKLQNKKRLKEFLSSSTGIFWFTSIVAGRPELAFSAIQEEGEIHRFDPPQWKTLKPSQKVFIVQLCDFWSREISFSGDFAYALAREVDPGMAWYYISHWLSREKFNFNSPSPSTDTSSLFSFVRSIDGQKSSFNPYGEGELDAIRQAGKDLRVPAFNAEKEDWLRWLKGYQSSAANNLETFAGEVLVPPLRFEESASLSSP